MKPITFERTMDFWRSDKVDPAAYTQVQDGRSERLLELIGDADRSWQICELGCGPGRNLEALRKAGFTKLTGIEINPLALQVMRGAYPELAESATILHGALETILPQIPKTWHYDLVFTMAVLLHIHPDSEWIFAHIARIVGRQLLVVEHEGYGCYDWCYSRDYRAIFENLGLKQAAQWDFGEACALADGRGPYIARLFVRE